jgi:hypothetical protein
MNTTLRIAFGLMVPALLAPTLQAQQPHQHRPGMTHPADAVMGFEQDKTTHHFHLYEDGGAIDVSVKDQGDAANLAGIRAHLSALPEQFKTGDFSQPAGVHPDKTVEGAADMARLAPAITYRYEQTDRGGRVLIETRDSAALAAVHAFLRFQITDHQTGDPLEVTRRR